jgi:hypothetical protein
MKATLLCILGAVALGAVLLAIAATDQIASWLPIAIVATAATVYLGLIVRSFGGVRSSARRFWHYLRHDAFKPS